MILIVISGLTEVWNLHFIEEIKKINLLSHFQKPSQYGRQLQCHGTWQFWWKAIHHAFFPPYSNIFFQNRVFDWQLQHLGREFELNFVPGRGGNLKELILKSSNAGERGGGESQCGGCWSLQLINALPINLR